MRASLSTALALAAAMVSLASCGGGGGSEPSGSNAFTINIQGQNGALSFTPNPASAGGRMVQFKNNDSIVHRVRLNDGSVDTGDIAPGATSPEVRMPNGGTNYHCSLHTTMIGAVQGQNNEPPPACTIYCTGE